MHSLHSLRTASHRFAPAPLFLMAFANIGRVRVDCGSDESDGSEDPETDEERRQAQRTHTRSTRSARSMNCSAAHTRAT